MTEKLTSHERCKMFLSNHYDNSTKMMSLLFIKNELSNLKETEETNYLKDLIIKMIDTLNDH
jgi:hypothetical protein